MTLINKIENVQLEAARIVTGGTKLTALHSLYTETGWEKLSLRRDNHRLILFYKMFNKNSPLYLQNMLPHLVGDLHTHNTRQSQNITEVRTRTNFYSDYFLPSTIKLWNRLPFDIRSSTSLGIFKKRIQNQNDKCPVYYYIGSRMGQILHARLRMSCSSLNEHLFVRNLVDSPNCICGNIESTTHFLFNCNRYTDLRNETVYTINYPVKIKTDVLLSY